MKNRSHNGCIECKKVKKKCDETKPSCGRCTTRGKTCTYKGDEKVKTGLKIATRPAVKENKVPEAAQVAMAIAEGRIAQPPISPNPSISTAAEPVYFFPGHIPMMTPEDPQEQEEEISEPLEPISSSSVKFDQIVKPITPGTSNGSPEIPTKPKIHSPRNWQLYNTIFWHVCRWAPLNEMTVRLQNLPPGTRGMEIYAQIEQCGAIGSFCLNIKRGICITSYESHAAASRAITELNGLFYRNRELECIWNE